LTFLLGSTKITWDGARRGKMKLPNRHKAVIPEAKIREYLLSTSHPYGRHKAAFFQRFGFSAESSGVLTSALRAHAEQCDVVRVDDTEFGTRYIVEGQLITPDGRAPTVRVVWFIEKGGNRPRLVTVYPAGGGIS
jgi:hypothetical protein